MKSHPLPGMMHIETLADLAAETCRDCRLDSLVGTWRTTLASGATRSYTFDSQGGYRLVSQDGLRTTRIRGTWSRSGRRLRLDGENEQGTRFLSIEEVVVEGDRLLFAPLTAESAHGAIGCFETVSELTVTAAHGSPQRFVTAERWVFGEDGRVCVTLDGPAPAVLDGAWTQEDDLVAVSFDHGVEHSLTLLPGHRLSSKIFGRVR